MKCTIIALALLLVPPAWTQEGSTSDAKGPVLVPGGFVDDAGRVVYVRDLERGIAAIDANDGHLLWESAEASKPLAVVAGRLMALAACSGSFRIVALDAADGRLLCESDPVVQHLFVLGVDHNGESTFFKSNAWVADGALFVKWVAGSKPPMGGAAVDPAHLERLYSRGIVRVDPETCDLEPVPDDGKPPPPSATLAKPPGELPETVRDLARQRCWELGVVVGNRVYGRAREQRAESAGTEVDRAYAVEAVDLATGQPIWSRRYERRWVPPPDAAMRP